MAVKRYVGALEKAAEAFELPAEVVANVPRLEVTGRSRIRVENHRGVSEFSENVVEVKGAGGANIRISGEKLRITAMDADELLVSGEVAGVEFLY